MAVEDNIDDFMMGAREKLTIVIKKIQGKTDYENIYSESTLSLNLLSMVREHYHKGD